MEYRFKVTPEIREAIHAAICCSENRILIRGDEVVRHLSDTRNPDPEITLTDTQLSLILHGIEKAIDAQSTDMGDWSRATQYIKTRDYLISETRKQFRVVKPQKPNWVVVALGDDCDSFVGTPHESPEVTQRFMELVGADQVSRVRQTMEETYQAFCRKNGEDLGFFCLYIEE